VHRPSEYWPKFRVFWDSPTLGSFKELIAGLLVIFGIAGEILFARLAASQQHQLRDRDKRRIAELNLLAEQEALARAKIEKQLIEAKIEILKLQEEMADRTISLEQANNIVNLLLPFSGQCVDVFVYGQTPEIFKLASKIGAVFYFSKWHSEQRVAIGKAIEGIIVQRMAGADPAT
jgi:hypothetical protein